MTKRAYILIAASIVTSGSAYAQEDLNRSVDVSKDYAPRVEKAVKLTIKPQTGDTVTLRPDLDYTVRPRAWMGGFGVTPIRAAQMNAGTYNAQYPIYIKVGGGFPGQTLLDIYATSIRPGTSGFGLYANHRAQLADLENYYDIKQRAKSTTNSIGVFGKAVFGRQNRLAIAGEAGFDYDVWSDYGAFSYSAADNSAVKIEDIRMQHYATPHAAVVFGHDFTDFSYLNFRIGGDVYHLQDRSDNTETGGKLFAEAGKQFGQHRFIFGVGADAYKGAVKHMLTVGQPVTDQANSIADVHADYLLAYKNITFGMGMRFAFEYPSGDNTAYNNTWFLPQVELGIALAEEFNPYAKLTSNLDINSYRNITANNPYLFRSFFNRVTAQAAAIYDVRAGFNGTLGGVFHYNVYAGGGIVKNDIIITTVLTQNTEGYFNNWDYAIQQDEERKSLFAGAEFEIILGNGFTVAAKGRYDKYDSDIFDDVNYLPKFTASFGVSYNHHDKWHLRAGAKVRGAYEFATLKYFPAAGIDDLRFKAPAAVDITLGADYSLSERLGIFLEASNLANQKLYPLPFYRGVGINVSAGINLRF